jgi:hypothetical protein
VSFLVNQADNTKDQLLGLIAKEIADRLDRVDVGQELTKALSRMTIEVKTQIRFMPTEGGDSGKLKPQIEHDVQVKKKGR